MNIRYPIYEGVYRILTFIRFILQLSLGLFLFFESHSFFSVRIPGQDAVRSQIYTNKRENRQVGLFFVLS